MPEYIVTDPTTGRKVKLTGDTPPTDADLDEIFAGLPAQQEQSGGILNSIKDQASSIIAPQKAAVEGALSLGSSAALQPIAGLAGLAQGAKNLLGGDGMSASDRVKQVQDFAYSPSQGSQDTLLEGAQEIGGIIPQVIKDGARGGAQAVGYLDDQLLEKTNPAIATAVKTAVLGVPEAIGAGKLISSTGKAAAQGLKNINLGNKSAVQNILEAGKPSNAVSEISKVVNSADQKDIVKRVSVIAKSDPDHPLVQKIQAITAEGGSDVSKNISTAISKAKMDMSDTKAARYVLKANGKGIQKSPEFKEVVKQGIDEMSASAIKGSSTTDKKKMKLILDEFVKARTNKIYAANHRPGDIVGETVMERVNYVKNVKKEAGDKLAKVAQDLKGKPIDQSAATQAFLDDLAEIGVTFKDGVADFSQSNIRAMDWPKKAVQTLLDDINPTDAYASHRLKKFIDDNVSYGKVGGNGLPNSVEVAVKKLRHNVDAALDNTYPQYKNINDRYSESLVALKEFEGAIGRTLDINSPNITKGLGSKSRGLLSNAPNRIRLEDTLVDLQRVANKYGGNIQDDVLTQVWMVDEMESLLGATAKTSLLGDVSKAVERGVAGQGLGGMVMDAGVGAIKKAQGVNEENAIKAMYKLLEQTN